METKVELQGIVRKTSNLNSPAGSLHEIINLRKMYGSWRPILPKHIIKQNFAPSSEMFIHTMDELEFYVTYDSDGKINARDDQGAVFEELTTLDPGLDIKFSSIGDFLIINDLTNYEQYIFRYYPDKTPKYTDVSSIPFLNMTLTATKTATFNEYTAEWNQDAFQAGWVLLETELRKLYPNYFEGWVFLRWGIELIDGTVVKHSTPIFLYCGDITVDHSNTNVAVIIRSYLYEIGYTIQATLPSDWSNYSNLIRGIAIYMTKPVSKYDLSQSGFIPEGNWVDLFEKTTSVVDLFRNASEYYLVHNIPFNKITNAGTGTIGSGKRIISRGTIDKSGIQHFFQNPGSTAWDSSFGLRYTYGQKPEINPDEFNVNDITSYNLLNVDDISHHTQIGIRTLNYNSRLFYGDIYSRLFDGYNIADILLPDGSGTTEFDMYIEVDLPTSLGLRTVRQTMKFDFDAFILPIVIGYPDIRAREMRIMHNSGGTLKKLTLTLEAHPVLNFAYATKLDGADITQMAKDSDGTISVPISIVTIAATLATLYTNLRDKNRVQLTELYNPYILPALNSYQVGEGNIVALGVNMIPLEDRFGTFPVFVFTSRGTWALNLSDSGSVVVSNIVPVSSAVCTNPDSIVVVENLLVFFASDGIKLLTGQTPTEISDLAETTPLSVLDGQDAYEQIKVQSSLNVVTDQISTIDLLEYCEDAKFAYDKKLNELIVSNYDYDYSYFYSFNDKMWFKSSQKFKKFISNYPNTYALSTGNDLVDLSVEESSGNVPVFFETKPILIGPDKEVKLARLILGGKFDVATNLYGALYLFGSNDGSVWTLVTGKEINGENIYNIIIPRLSLSLRYIILVFSGTISQDSSISEFRIIT
jgi:hypothetical protein